MSEFRGWISTFWEQGMEEPAWLIFQEEDLSESRTVGWSREGMHTFRSEDHLIIIAEDDAILWEGVLTDRREGWFRKLCASDCLWYPADVGAEQWSALFTHQPPLRAILRRGGI